MSDAIKTDAAATEGCAAVTGSAEQWRKLQRHIVHDGRCPKAWGRISDHYEKCKCKCGLDDLLAEITHPQSTKLSNPD